MSNTNNKPLPWEYANENYSAGSYTPNLNPNVPLKTSHVWAVLTPQGHILGIYTSPENTWKAIDETYRKSGKCELKCRRIPLDTWLGD